MKISKVKRVQDFHAPKGAGFFEKLIAFIVWGLFAIFTLVILYMHFFGRSLAQILGYFGAKNPQVPFWFSLVMTLFFFPFTLIIILIAALGKMMD